ncbi:energy transducer TonB [Pedobacter sp. L105]|uniref:energy transducer TonB family protein n=1 Tax=Pedobacter sp. L105 TaxID=1641871 RepID=UPI00131B35B1|nr:energy transducer TonB [Pedobacter sp. L105]
MNNNWLDIELLEDYLDGKLDNQAMHQLEKQALEDPFVAQALAGLTESRSRKQSISLLQKQLYERIAQQQIIKKESVFTWQRLSVASAAAVMFISVSIFFFMRASENREQLSKNKPHSVEVNLTPTPAAVDSAKSDSYAANTPAVAQEPVSAGIIRPKKEVLNNTMAANAVQSADIQKDDVADTAVSKPADVLNEVVVKNARVATIAPAVSTPVGGWANLDSYLSDNNKFGKDDKSGKFVALSFLIDAEGKPSAIKVEKSASPEFDAEAVRLIKEGPKWEQPKSADARVSYTIAF